jgi:hypothetical protein
MRLASKPGNHLRRKEIETIRQFCSCLKTWNLSSPACVNLATPNKILKEKTMKTRFTALVVFVLLGMMVLSACGAPPQLPQKFTPSKNPPMEAPLAQSAGEADTFAKEESAPSSDLAVGPGL